MDLTLQPALRIVKQHAGTGRTQMRMIVYTKENIKHTILVTGCAKNPR